MGTLLRHEPPQPHEPRQMEAEQDHERRADLSDGALIVGQELADEAGRSPECDEDRRESADEAEANPPSASMVEWSGI